MRKIAWNEPAQPAIRDDYFSSLIGPEMNADKAVELVDRMQKRVDSLDEETVSHVSSVLSEMVKLANELSGMDNYYNGIVSKELKDPSNVGEVLLGVIHRESVTNQSDFVNEGIQSILDQFGIKSDQPLTRKEKLLAFIGFMAGSMWERLVEDQSQIEPPAWPNPLEMVLMGILKTNGKKC